MGARFELWERRMTRKGWPLFALVALVALSVVGCASGGGSTVADSYWRVEMGQTTQGALSTALDKVFRKHAVVVRRAQAAPGDRELRYETEWVLRDLLATEEGVGTTGARNRIIIVARQGSGAGIYRLRWQLENEVTTAAVPDWHAGPLPEEVRERYRPVFSDLELEVRTAQR